MIRLFPLLFLLLWSSAFVSSKFIVQDASPFLSLAVRFIIVSAGFWIVCLIQRSRLRAPASDISFALATGVLFHGIYLGGVFYAQSRGMTAGLSSLIVSLQPVLTAALAGPLLSERLNLTGWAGIILGFCGAVMVLGIDTGDALPLIAYGAVLASLLAVTTGTLWTKASTQTLSLTATNFYQAVGGSLFHLLVMVLIEDIFFYPTTELMLSMAWQICAVSFGAFSLLMYLIKTGSASQTAALFFLVPPVSALMAFIILSERLDLSDITGFAVASFGVYLATRPQNRLDSSAAEQKE